MIIDHEHVPLWSIRNMQQVFTCLTSSCVILTIFTFESNMPNLTCEQLLDLSNLSSCTGWTTMWTERWHISMRYATRYTMRTVTSSGQLICSYARSFANSHRIVHSEGSRAMGYPAPNSGKSWMVLVSLRGQTRGGEGVVRTAMWSWSAWGEEAGGRLREGENVSSEARFKSILARL